MKKKILLLIVCIVLLTGCGLKKEVLDTSATVELSDGTLETVKIEDLLEMYENNSAKYWKVYANQDISFVGTIESMHSYGSYNGSSYGVDQIKFKEGWTLNLVADSHDLLQYDIGDKLSVKSTLGHCGISDCEVSSVGATYTDGLFIHIDNSELSLVE